ncbi:TraB/GumN family protein [Sphingopyxis sp. BSN-002]|uniref:TraB/GumN family protein n=1 Tax=Sphingopyxis sp. BSN-002 TaxID=2911495 RepID=UPI001EDA2F60|nr:TraB/GumN family protein [Sphingopyxis sp. BSN-002]UKK83580.1 TraB/GumN family protein [Sphingopyxis sp. BSN-002]
MALLLAAGAPAASHAIASDPVAEADAGEDIVVTARRSGAPMWTIRTAAGTVVLVGEIAGVPKATPWRPERLEGATDRAQRVILGTKAKVSPGDILRLIFKGGGLVKLPKGRVASDYLDAGQMKRLQALETRFDQDYARSNFLMTAFDLLSKRLSFNRDTADDASDVVRKAARQSKIPTQPVGEVRGEDMLDNLFAAAPETHIPCLEAAMTATEAGPDIVTARGEAWTRFDVPAVMANPLEEALGRCWPWTNDSFGPELRQQWVGAIRDATAQPGVTLAVVPLRILAEKDGVLDRLQAQGLPIDGPAWHFSAAGASPS